MVFPVLTPSTSTHRAFFTSRFCFNICKTKISSDQKTGRMTTHLELLPPGLLQGLFFGHLFLLLFPLPLLFLLRLPRLLSLPCLFRLPLLTLLLDMLMGCSYFGPCHLLNPGLLGHRLALDLFEILFRIGVYQNRFRVYDGRGNSPCVDVLGGGHNAGVFGLEEGNFDAPHDPHPPYIPRCLIPPLFRTPPNFPRNLIGFCISSGSRDEILEGGILLCPVTLL